MSLRFHSTRIVFLFFATITSVLCVHAQCSQRLSELPSAPELWGFRLGMTRDEVKVRVPQTVFGRTDEFGVSKTTINPSFDPKIDKTKFESVRSISLDMLDDHLTSLWIGYDETFRVQSIEEFVTMISQELKVPANWSSWKSRGKQLKCVDFQLIVTTIAGGPSLRILDTGADDVIAARRQAKEERDATAGTAATEEATDEIVGDKQLRVYYLTTCAPPREMTEANRIHFKNTEEAEKAGFKLAKNCH